MAARVDMMIAQSIQGSSMTSETTHDQGSSIWDDIVGGIKKIGSKLFGKADDQLPLEASATEMLAMKRKYHELNVNDFELVTSQESDDQFSDVALRERLEGKREPIKIEDLNANDLRNFVGRVQRNEIDPDLKTKLMIDACKQLEAFHGFGKKVS